MPGRAEDVKNRTAPEFEALGGLNKLKAAGNLVTNMNTMREVPPYLTAAIANFKNMYEEVIAMIKEVSSSLDNLKTGG